MSKNNLLIKFNTVCKKLNLPMFIIQEAFDIFVDAKDFSDDKDYLVSACIYAACRKKEFRLLLDEISEKSGCGKLGVGDLYRKIKMEFNLEIPSGSVMDYIPRMADELKVDADVQGSAISMLMEGFDNKLPKLLNKYLLAAVTIYIVTKRLNKPIDFSKSDISEKQVKFIYNGLTDVI